MDDKRLIPSTAVERKALREQLDSYVAAQGLCPPLSLKQLEELADAFIIQQQLPVGMRDWLMVEIHNQVWKDVVAGIPFERRLLLLPKCLSKYGGCKGEYDEFGLLCHRCGSCLIPSLQDEADKWGMLSMVAEGFTQVIELIENQVIDAVIGVSCLGSLEKAFPLLVRHAVPGLAIALNDGGCKDTHVDVAYVRELMGMEKEDEQITLINHDQIRDRISKWFSPVELKYILSPLTDETSNVSFNWMNGEGHRWRPYLVAAVYQSLTGDSVMTEDVHRAAVAVECFHKASLIHDDIQDGDLVRYDKPTINAMYGDAWAINAGDFLLGEGYRILAQSSNPELVRAIASAHLALCKGQGAELTWCANPTPVTLEYVKDIFIHKTVPAFEVSLLLGLMCTGNHVHLRPILKQYSEALGIAYQLKDDLDDFSENHPVTLRPSAVLALICEDEQNSELVDELLHASEMKAVLEKPEHKAVLKETLRQVEELLDFYHQQALDVLKNVEVLELKRLLFQVTEKILER